MPALAHQLHMADDQLFNIGFLFQILVAHDQVQPGRLLISKEANAAMKVPRRAKNGFGYFLESDIFRQVSESRPIGRRFTIIAPHPFDKGSHPENVRFIRNRVVIALNLSNAACFFRVTRHVHDDAEIMHIDSRLAALIME